MLSRTFFRATVESSSTKRYSQMEIKLSKDEIEIILLEHINMLVSLRRFNTVTWDSSYSYARTATLSFEEPKNEAQ